MEIAVVAVGRVRAGPESELCARYLDRARTTGRALGFRGFGVVEIPESRASRAADRVSDEEGRLLAGLGPGSSVVCLDPRGDQLDSEAFAHMLGRTADSAIPRTTFIIGGPDGLGNGIIRRADRVVAFGRVTWPHQLARILLAEQVYRSMTILSGHPYHRA